MKKEKETKRKYIKDKQVLIFDVKYGKEKKESK